jgi:hypothetical protein
MSHTQWAANIEPFLKCVRGISIVADTVVSFESVVPARYSVYSLHVCTVFWECGTCMLQCLQSACLYCVLRVWYLHATVFTVLHVCTVFCVQTLCSCGTVVTFNCWSVLNLAKWGAKIQIIWGMMLCHWASSLSSVWMITVLHLQRHCLSLKIQQIPADLHS